MAKSEFGNIHSIFRPMLYAEKTEKDLERRLLSFKIENDEQYREARKNNMRIVPYCEIFLSLEPLDTE